MRAVSDSPLLASFAACNSTVIPAIGLCRVLVNASAVCVSPAQALLSLGKTLRCRFLPPDNSLPVILLRTYALVVMPAKKVLRHCEALMCQLGYNVKRLLKCALADGGYGFLQFGVILIHCYRQVIVGSSEYNGNSQ